MKRVLCDRHQADLFYSLQLLFEDRLGFEVYTPIGQEWFEEGYWQFGAQHLGRALANQFLGIDARYAPRTVIRSRDAQGYALIGDYWQTFDPAHPEREQRCLTLAQFRALGDWAFIVASVQDNQTGFARLAQEVGARYVYQVGNTRQEVDWSLEPLALVSSEVAIPDGARAVRYHQEFDADGTFRYRPPGGERGLWAMDPLTISSFVNLFPRIECYPAFEKVRALLPEVMWFVFGIDGPDGNLHPAQAIADAMAGSGFAWHDKVTGDGFGHVLHNWAAVGRPLIGHASHYAGQMGGPLWEDGVTCIDLDRHSPAETAWLIREIVAEPARHRAMCRAIRDRFDNLVNFDAEAGTIRALLA